MLGAEQTDVRRVAHAVESVLGAVRIGGRREAHTMLGAEQIEVRRIVLSVKSSR